MQIYFSSWLIWLDDSDETVSKLRIEKKRRHTSRSQAPPGNQENDDFRSTILSGPIIVKQFQTDPPSQLMKHDKYL